MKHFVLVFAGLCFYSAKVSALGILPDSIPKHNHAEFGIKSGMNIATVKDINSDPKNRVGWYGGGFIGVQIHGKFFFQPELLFSAKGYRYFGNLYDTKKTAIRLNYIAAPILLGYKIDTKTSFFLGPEIGYLFSAYEVLPYVYPSGERINVSSGLPEKFDAELDIGLKYQATKKLGLEIRYTHGFKNIYTIDAVGMRNNDVLAGNRVFQIGAYYVFHK